MTRRIRIYPTPGYHSRTNTINRIMPRANYQPPSLHTQRLANGIGLRAIDAEWCPICHHRDIGEREYGGRVLWHCNECNHEW